MLGIRGVGREAAGYYLADPAHELPDTSPPRWVGQAAAPLGLHGAPGPETLSCLLGGRHPRHGGTLGSGRTRVAGYDLTFSAPKSASVLLALGGIDAARRVVAAHDDAVAGALRYLEEHAVTSSRRRGDERLVLATDGMVAAQFTHAVNRNGDPHLHSHVVMANVVHGADGRWSSCDRRGLDAHRAAASAVYEAQLRAGITAGLGLLWAGAPGRSPEVDGIAPALLGEFSSRRADIRRHRHEAGPRGGSAAMAWAITRAPKSPSPPFVVLEAEWRRRAQAAGHGGPGTRLTPLTRTPAGRGWVDEHRFAGVISLTAHGGAHRRDVVAAFADGAVDGVGASALGRLVDAWVPPAAVGVREPLQARGAVVPGRHLLHALGPRPLDPAAHEVWIGAARTVEAYRERWGLQRATEPLGPTSATVLASFPPARLAEHARACQVLASARARLGRRGPAVPEIGLGR